LPVPFNLQPLLTGKLVRLRPLEPADFDALFDVASDPLIWEQHPERDRYREPVFRRFFRGALDSKGALLALDADGGQVIGSSRFYGYDEATREVEIGWTFLARRYWGGRYNGEMKRLMLDHAFKWVDHVLFVIGAQNFRSRKATEKMGAVRIGSRAAPDRPDSLVYRIDVADWMARRDTSTRIA
jgi:RimJ/RimL family protein N-acetyltransferase